MTGEPAFDFRQLVRYAISGVGLAVVYAIVYELVLRLFGDAPQLANALAFVAATALGYLIHSRWSFRGHDATTSALGRTAKFAIVNLCSFALNGFWVWLVAGWLGMSAHWPLLPILGVTPWLSYGFNRYWTFAGTAGKANG